MQAPHRLKVALVTESFFPASAGAVDGSTTTVRHVADRLIGSGHEVLVVAPAPGLTSYRRSRVDRIRPVGRRAAQVAAALDRFGPDVVHITSPGAVGLRALTQARRLGLPTVVAQQTPVPRPLAEAWTARVAHRADRVLVTAPWMRAALGALDTRTRLWSPGVDPEVFGLERRDAWLHDRWARADRPGGPLVVVGYAGALRKRHGVRRLSALAALPGIRLVVIGDGPQRRWLGDRLPGAKFTGPMATGDLAVALASLDLLVHPGPDLTCAHALREAAASGTPVVAARSGGARDLVDHLHTGLLFDPHSRTDLARAVAAVAADPYRALLGEEGRRRAVARTWADAVDELVATHYAAVLRRHARRAA